MFTTSDDIFIKRPPSAAATLAEQVTNIPRSKLLFRSLGAFPVREVSENSVAIEYPHGREHVAIDLVVKVPGQPIDIP